MFLSKFRIDLYTNMNMFRIVSPREHSRHRCTKCPRDHKLNDTAKRLRMPVLADLAARLLHSSVTDGSVAVEKMETGLRRSLADEDPKKECAFDRLLSACEVCVIIQRGGYHAG